MSTYRSSWQSVEELVGLFFRALLKEGEGVGYGGLALGLLDADPHLQYRSWVRVFPAPTSTPAPPSTRN